MLTYAGTSQEEGKPLFFIALAGNHQINDVTGSLIKIFFSHVTKAFELLANIAIYFLGPYLLRSSASRMHKAKLL